MNAAATQSEAVVEPILVAKRPRLVSLDVFRGLTVAGMILVNNPGSWGAQYAPLKHAAWHGCTPTDLVMPFFLFIVGVSIVYAMDSKREDRSQHAGLLWRVLRRSALLFVIAWALALFPSSPAWDTLIHKPGERLHNLRIMGVLQRIGVVYLACALLFLKGSWRSWMVVTLGILIGYWAVLQFVPVPGGGGGIGSATWQPGQDFGSWVDRKLLGSSHLYKSKEGWDPEGLFSSLAAIATGMVGVMVGWTLKRGAGDIAGRVAWIFSAGVGMCVAGYLWSLGFPQNKALWTSSYALVTGGMAALALAAGYWVIDVKGIKWWTPPGLWFGVNAITAFAGSALMVKTLGLLPLWWNEKRVGGQGYVYQRWILPNVSPPELASLTWALLFVAAWTGIVWGMYRMKWMLKV